MISFMDNMDNISGQVEPEEFNGVGIRFIPCRIREIYAFEAIPVKTPNTTKRVLKQLMSLLQG